MTNSVFFSRNDQSKKYFVESHDERKTIFHDKKIDLKNIMKYSNLSRVGHCWTLKVSFI